MVKVIKTTSYLMLWTLAFLGNSLVVAAIWRNHRLQTVINLLIFNMAVSDMLTLFFSLPRRIQTIYLPKSVWLVDGILGTVTCKIAPFGEDTLIIVSVTTLQTIAIERFYAVLYPMKRQPIDSKKKCFILIAFTWIISALYPAKYLYTNEISYKGTTPYCVFNPVGNVFELVVLASITIIPFLVLCSLNSAIILSLHRQKANLHLASDERRRRTKENFRVTYMLVTVVVVFAVSWIPFTVYSFLNVLVWGSWDLCNLSYEFRQLLFIGDFLTFVYTAINPLIYYVFNENYRKGFHKLLCCRMRNSSCCTNHISPSEDESHITCSLKPDPSHNVVLLSFRTLETELFRPS